MHIFNSFLLIFVSPSIYGVTQVMFFTNFRAKFLVSSAIFLEKVTDRRAAWEYQKEHNDHRSSADREEVGNFFDAQSVKLAFRAT